MRPIIKFNLHAVYGLAHADFPGEDQFSLPLPFEITHGVRLRTYRPSLSPQSFDPFRKQVGAEAIERAETIRHALIHRYTPILHRNEETNEIVTEDAQDHSSAQLVANLRVLLRLIRPTREEAGPMHGNLRQDGSLDVVGFDVPSPVVDIPENQKLFAVRNEDIETLRSLAASFLRCMRGDYWEVRMAADFYDRGHLNPDAAARYLLWMAAIEGLYTSFNEQGSHVAKARIKWFLGARTSIYPRGELHDLNQDPTITVGDILDDLYLMRNCISHGDRLDERYFAIKRYNLAQGLPLFGVLTEAASFIIRHSLMKILREGLIEEFKGPSESSAYFTANGLSKRDI